MLFLRSHRWLSSGHQYDLGLLQCFCLHPASVIAARMVSFSVAQCNSQPSPVRYPVRYP